jgi:acetate CoA/acetoacetate CoA-transferase alpha subunit
MQTVFLQDAVAMIPSGAHDLGVYGRGNPERPIDEPASQGKRNLTVIANDMAIPGGA